jgi:hypothetical protein
VRVGLIRPLRVTFQDAAFECVPARYAFMVYDGAFDDLLAHLGEMP